MVISNNVQILWYEGLAHYLCIATGEDAVLCDFFTLREWSDVVAIFEAVLEEEDLQLNDKGFRFEHNMLTLYSAHQELPMRQQDFFVLVDRLYKVLIDGANEDHHSVRFEPWWQEFIEAAYLLQQRCKAELLMQEIQQHDLQRLQG